MSLPSTSGVSWVVFDYVVPAYPVHTQSALLEPEIGIQILNNVFSTNKIMPRNGGAIYTTLTIPIVSV